MKVLLLAPQPFFQERGTPIAVRLLAETLCAAGHEVDLLTYHEGEDVVFPGLRIVRIPRLPLIGNVSIGFSWKKLVCDAALTVSLLRRAHRGRYQVVHAGEESIFPAVWFSARHGAAVVYDMDSDLTDQVLAKKRILRPFRGLFEAIERSTLGRASLILPVCPHLAEKARRLAPGVEIRVLEDIPLTDGEAPAVDDLRDRFRIRGPLALYVGNLEGYQGIDLLLEGMAGAGDAPVSLVVIGGLPADVEHYRRRAAELGIGERAHFTGPRPIRELGGYLRQADLLVSPRTEGENTPMKIYSYLASGKPILATEIGSHTQALDASCAVLVRPDPGCFAAGLRRLAGDPGLRERLGRAGAARARERYSREAYREKLLAAYAVLESPARKGAA